MAKQYGNTGGNAEIPTNFDAPGAWTAPTEVYRQKAVVGKWPSALVPAVSLDAGEVVFCCSSGTRDELLASNKYIEANGQEVSRNAYPELFDVLQETYGPGDGSTTFRLPNYRNENQYFKSTVISGIDWTTLSGAGVLPSHTHVCQAGIKASDGFNYNTDPAGPYVRSVGPVTKETSIDEDPRGNHVRRNQVFVLLAASGLGGQAEPGIVSPFLLPLPLTGFSEARTENIIVCSGSLELVDSNPNLLRQYGTLFGGDGSTTIGTPDYRGQFLQNANQTNAGVNVSGASLGASGFLEFSTAAHRHLCTSYEGEDKKFQSNPSLSYFGPFRGPATSTASIGSLDTENRPGNVNVLFVLVGG